MSVTKSIPSYEKALDGLIQQLDEMLPEEQFAVFNRDAQNLGETYPNPLKVRVGDTAPDFSLPNATGKEVRLYDLLKEGAVVLSFYRGTWCPYCNLQLKQLQEILPQLKEMGANLVAISPQNPDASLDMQQKNELEFEVLSDVGNIVAKHYTSVFRYGDAPLQAMKDLGYDFHSFYSDESGEIPVPATIVIASDGRIAFASSEGGDYRQRIEPKMLMETLGKLE